ncbi:MAG: hypothetical protein H8K10_13040 [Nitrospira sp.]|nr:hypothetical protein [Nitrospira sp.]
MESEEATSRNAAISSRLGGIEISVAGITSGTSREDHHYRANPLWYSILSTYLPEDVVEGTRMDVFRAKTKLRAKSLLAPRPAPKTPRPIDRSLVRPYHQRAAD